MAEAFDLETLPARSAPASPACDALLDAVARLKDDHREVVSLFYLEGYDIKGIGRFLGLAEGTVKRWLHEARNQLRKDLVAMERDVFKRNVPGDDFDKRVLDGMTVVAGDWQMQGQELSGMAWPKVSALRGEISRVITRKSYPGDRVVVEFDAVCYGGYDGGHIQCFMTSKGSLEEVRSAGEDEMMHSFRIGVSCHGRHPYAYVAPHVVAFGTNRWSRQSITCLGESDFNARHGNWVHVKVERLGQMMRLWVGGVPIQEHVETRPAPAKVHIMLGADVGHVHYRNFRVCVPNEGYVKAHVPPMKLFGPYKRRREVFDKHPDITVREAGITLGETNQESGLVQVSGWNKVLAPAGVGSGRPCRRSDMTQDVQFISLALANASEWSKADEVRLEVEYLDEQADSLLALYNTWYHSSSPTVDKLVDGSGQWRTHTFHLRDAKFVPWGQLTEGNVSIGPNRRGELHVARVRLLEVDKPKAAWEELVEAYRTEIASPQAEWVVPHYLLAMADVLGSHLGQAEEARQITRRLFEEYPQSEVMETWCRKHRTSRW
jgi:hypothetical protein